MRAFGHLIPYFPLTRIRSRKIASPVRRGFMGGACSRRFPITLSRYNPVVAGFLRKYLTEDNGYNIFYDKTILNGLWKRRGGVFRGHVYGICVTAIKLKLSFYDSYGRIGETTFLCHPRRVRIFRLETVLFFRCINA